MRNQSANTQARTIDHEPLSDNTDAPVFGKRTRATAGQSVTRDFFTRTSTNLPARKLPHASARTQEESDNSTLFVRLRDLDWPLKYLAFTFLIALALPMTLISITERIPHWMGTEGVDTMTTSSISPNAGVSVSDVSMTRIIKNSTSLVSVYGRISYAAGPSKTLKPLLVTLYDKDGKTLQSWLHTIPIGKIRSKQNFRFITSAIDYSGNAETVSVVPVK